MTKKLTHLYAGTSRRSLAKVAHVASRRYLNQQLLKSLDEPAGFASGNTAKMEWFGSQ